MNNRQFGISRQDLLDLAFRKIGWSALSTRQRSGEVLLALYEIEEPASVTVVLNHPILTISTKREAECILSFLEAYGFVKRHKGMYRLSGAGSLLAEIVESMCHV